MKEEIMKLRNLELTGRICHIYGSAPADACMICGVDSHAQGEIADAAEQFYGANGAESCCLVLFETADWNGDFSPWQSAPAFGEEPFTGKAPETLAWVTRVLFPYLEMEKMISTDTKKYIAGYSLSGLFALWSFLETDLFDGAASCSGSLWMPGWMEYVQSHVRGRDGAAYLSLGSKEEKTKNALMSAVGDNMRESYRILKNTPHITKAVLEWNKGGHFSNTTERLVKGMRWLLNDARDSEPGRTI